MPMAPTILPSTKRGIPPGTRVIQLSQVFMPIRLPPSATYWTSSPMGVCVIAEVYAFAGTSVALSTRASPKWRKRLGCPSASATAKLMSSHVSRLFSCAVLQSKSQVSSVSTGCVARTVRAHMNYVVIMQMIRISVAFSFIGLFFHRKTEKSPPLYRLRNR